MSRRHTYDPGDNPLDPNQPETDRLSGEELSPLDDLDELVTTVEAEGIDLSSDGKMPSARSRNSYQELGDAQDEEVGAPTDAPDKTSDSVRLYLREMGTVPLLTQIGRAHV